MAKVGQETKRERNRNKRQLIDKTTNWYMTNLAWGIFVIIVLRIVESGYSSLDMVLKMPVIMMVWGGIFVAGAIGLFVCGKLNLLSRSRRFYNYSIFSAVLALGSLWIAFYAKIRLFAGTINPDLLNIDSRWWISRGIVVAVAAYLVITLIWTAVKIALIEKGKLK